MKAPRTLLALGFAAAIGGCVPAVAPPQPTAPPPAPVVQPRPAAPPRGPGMAPNDSGPSSDALEVLATIPEPLSLEEQVPAPEPVPGPPPRAPMTIPAPAAAYDTLRAGEPEAESAPDASIPVPAPVVPLGQPQPAMSEPPASDTTRAAAPASPPAQRPATPPAQAPPAASPPASPPATPVDPDAPCWRLQIAAPLERVKGEAMRDAAASQLLLEMTVELDARRWKVRTRDCWSRDVAERVQQRALDSGFKGAFLTRAARR